MCLVITVLGSFWEDSDSDTQEYFHFYLSALDREQLLNHIINFLMYYQLSAFLIPISLYVTMEVMKTIQSSFLKNDIKMANRDKGRIM